LVEAGNRWPEVVRSSTSPDSTCFKSVRKVSVG
jgi:hypothetical protein